MASILKHLRSSTADKRPTASGLADGQIALNTASGTPAMFFKDSAGNIVKVGPAHIGTTAPNVSPAGSAGNSDGELWIDESLTTRGLKYYDGTAFVNLTPSGTTSTLGLVELATDAETQAGTDNVRVVTPSGLQSKISNSTSTTSSTTIASSTAVKSAFDLANAALPKTGGTLTGELLISPSGSLVFEGSSDDSFETTIAVTNPTADRTITFPNVTGNVVTTGDSGTVTSTMILDDTIVNADINSAAAIAHSKLANIAAGSVLLGNASNVPTATALSGDVTINSSGVTAISAGVIVNADINASAAIVDTKLDTIATADKVSLSALNIDGATDIGGALENGDLFIVDDGAGGTNRKAQAFRMAQLTYSGVTGDITVASGGTAAISAGVIVNADVNASAAIAGTKISPDFGSQTITTTGVVSAALGAAATPSLTFTGDLNTGIYSPGADQVAISTGGSGRLFVDANGNVGIGGNSNSYAGLTTLTVNSSTGSVVDWNISNTRTGTFAVTSSQVSLGSNTNIPVIFTQANSEKMRLTSTGLGIGTSSPSVKLEVSGSTSSNPEIRVVDGTVNSQWYASNTGELIFGTFSNHPVTFRSNGSPRLSISSAGNVGIGTTSPGTYGAFAVRIASGGTSGHFSDGATGSLYIDHASNIISLRADTSNLAFQTLSTERARIDSSGRLLVGTSSARSNDLFGTSQSQVEGTDSATSSISIIRNVAATGAGGIALCKSRSSSIGGVTVVQSGDVLGFIDFQGADGTDFARAATIEAQVDGTPGNNDMPGRLVFSTTADGASSPTERMRISNIGVTNVFISSGDGIQARNAAAASTSYANFVGRYGATDTTTSGTPSFIVYTNGDVKNTNNSYTAISDAKLKENIVDANPQWDDIKALRVRNFTLKEGQTHKQIGLIAQEVEPICPGLVGESPDRDAEGNDLGTVTKSVNYSVLYMKAVKALQEAMERIETLEAKVAALESA